MHIYIYHDDYTDLSYGVGDIYQAHIRRQDNLSSIARFHTNHRKRRNIREFNQNGNLTNITENMGHLLCKIQFTLIGHFDGKPSEWMVEDLLVKSNTRWRIGYAIVGEWLVQRAGMDELVDWWDLSGFIPSPTWDIFQQSLELVGNHACLGVVVVSLGFPW